MHQVQMEEYGGPAVLHLVEVPDAEPGPGQVAVRTAAAGITFVETQVRAGRSPRPGPGPALPAVLGNGVEGTIVSAGADVDPAAVGMLVVTATGGLGGYADRVVVGAEDPVPVPPGLARGTAVALLADGRTALALARAAALTTGDRVLVTAAAGGVGSLLVQLARAAGARHMAAAASSPRKLEVTRTLGADVVADYTSPGWADQVRAATGSLDVVFDGVGGDIGDAALGLLGRGGRFLAYGAASGSFTGASGREARHREPGGPVHPRQHAGALVRGQPGAGRAGTRPRGGWPPSAGDRPGIPPVQGRRRPCDHRGPSHDWEDHPGAWLTGPAWTGSGCRDRLPENFYRRNASRW